MLDLRGEINGFGQETLDTAYCLSDHYVEIFNITRLSDFMGVYPDEQSALSGTYVS